MEHRLHTVSGGELCIYLSPVRFGTAIMTNFDPLLTLEQSDLASSIAPNVLLTALWLAVV